MKAGNHFNFVSIFFFLIILTIPVLSENGENNNSLQIPDGSTKQVVNSYSLSNSYYSILYTLGQEYSPESLLLHNLLVTSIPVSVGIFDVKRADMIIPSHWKKGFQVGVFFDPILKITWLYNWHYHTCYSPETGWVLLTGYSNERIPVAQFYFDPESRQLYEVNTGHLLTEVNYPAVSGSKPDKILPNSSMVISPEYDSTFDTAEAKLLTSSNQSDLCRAGCSTCVTGYCMDCNKNGICDNTEESPTVISSVTDNPEIMPVTTSTTNIPNISLIITPSLSSTTPIPVPSNIPDIIASVGLDENPQAIVQKNATFAPKPLPSPSSDFDNSQENPISINLMPNLPLDRVNYTDKNESTVSEFPQDSGYYGVSENPEESVYYYKAISGKGPFSVIECSVKQKCRYCVDEDSDQKCSVMECHLIKSNLDPTIYCLDCNKDGACDLDKILIMNCYQNEECMEIDYCDDSNLNGICDNEENEPGVEEIDTIYGNWWDIDWQ